MISFRLKDKNILEILAWLKYNRRSGLLRIPENTYFSIVKGNIINPFETAEELVAYYQKDEGLSRQENILSFEEKKVEVAQNSQIILTENLILQLSRLSQAPDYFRQYFKQGWTIKNDIRTKADLNEAEKQILDLATGKNNLKQLSKLTNLSVKQIVNHIYGLHLIGEVKLAPSRQNVLENSRNNKINLDGANINRLEIARLPKIKKSHVIIGGVVSNMLALLLLYFGGIKILELKLLDLWQQSKPTSKTQNELITVVEVTEEDIQKMQSYPVSDEILAQAITNLQQKEPLAIGLDIYRDFPVPLNATALSDAFDRYDNIIGVFKHQPPVVLAPPRLAAKENIGFSDLVNDSDLIVRRGILSLEDNSEISLSLSTKLSSYYLLSKKYDLSRDSNNHLVINNRPLIPLTSKSGIYWGQKDLGGYQILTNYQPNQHFPSFSLTQILNNEFESSLIKNRIILIGITAASVNDRAYTPLENDANQGTPGVYIHANILNSLIQFAEHGNNLKAINKNQEILLIIAFSCLSLAILKIVNLIKIQFKLNFLPFYLVGFSFLLTEALIIICSGIGFYGFSYYVPILSVSCFSSISLLWSYFYKIANLENRLFASDYSDAYSRLFLELYWQDNNFSGDWEYQNISLILFQSDLHQYRQIRKTALETIGKETMFFKIAEDTIVILLPKTNQGKAQQLASKIANALNIGFFGISTIHCPGDLEELIGQAYSSLYVKSR